MLLGALGFLSSAHSQQSTAQTSPPPPAVEHLSAGVYRLGAITLDKTAREIRFPAVVNQVVGIVEYLLVGQGGKTHESILRTDVEPIQVQTAMLLLGLNSVSAAKAEAGSPPPPSALDKEYLATAKLPEGKPVKILLRWKTAEGNPVERPAEAVISDARIHAPMADGSWLYNGSFFSEGRFMAQDEKSVAALVTDPAALINNPRPGHDDDANWSAATEQLPPVETPVEFVIRLSPANP